MPHNRRCGASRRPAEPSYLLGCVIRFTKCRLVHPLVVDRPVRVLLSVVVALTLAASVPTGGGRLGQGDLEAYVVARGCF